MLFAVHSVLYFLHKMTQLALENVSTLPAALRYYFSIEIQISQSTPSQLHSGSSHTYKFTMHRLCTFCAKSAKHTSAFQGAPVHDCRRVSSSFLTLFFDFVAVNTHTRLYFCELIRRLDCGVEAQCLRVTWWEAECIRTNWSGCLHSLWTGRGLEFLRCELI